MKLAVIIPTLNEAERLPELLTTLNKKVDDVWVGDCGSTDGTVNQAEAMGVKVLTEGCCCRAGAMNSAAQEAIKQGADWLWFLHADSRLPEHWWEELQRLSADPELVGGAFHFDFHWDERTHEFERRLKWIRRINRWRYSLSAVYFGDQGIFCRSDVYQQIGGFQPVLLLEDVYFSKSLKQRGKVALANSSIATDSRRFVRNGPMRQLWLDARILVKDRLGLNTQPLIAEYQA